MIGLFFSNTPRMPLLQHILCREIVRLICNLPWNLRGPDAFHASACFCLSDGELRLSLDGIAEKMRPVILEALACKTSPKGLDQRPFIPVHTPSAFEDYDGVSCLLSETVREGWHDYCLEIEYVPMMNDHAMPTYFWLGELAEAA